MIDVTTEHAELGRTFANRVWIISKVGILSLPFRQDTPQGKEAEYIRLTYSDPISKWTFRSKVDEIIWSHSEFKNAIGGWTDEDGSVMTFVFLNDDETNQRASCLVIYNESTGIAVFNTMSNNL